MLLMLGSIVRPRMLHFTNHMLQVACGKRACRTEPHRVEIILSPAASACSRWFAPTERILYFPAGSGCHCNSIQSPCNTQPPHGGDTHAACRTQRGIPQPRAG